jgi:hypothetical protein
VGMRPITTSNPSAAADEVMPSKTAMMYGFCSSGTTTSMARSSSRGRPEPDPAGEYPESLRCFCTRRRVSRETSARSLRTFDTVATETPAAFAICAKVARSFGTVASGLKSFGRPKPAITIPITLMYTSETTQSGGLDTKPHCFYLRRHVSIVSKLFEAQ